ncbi:hypothetical protein [Pedobacter sp. MW01-1-1]|uniref:hypothetical protein n=1 Tax=Pedobacter sp. MW01-1-1 TaxID=3383027 RepID=UPI003FEE3835
MSIISANTERKALYEIAKTLRFFKNLNFLQISAGDDIRIRHAQNIIKDVIAINGFKVCFNKRRGTYLKKL